MTKIWDSFESNFKLIDPHSKYFPAKIATFYHIIGGMLLKFPIQIDIIDIDMRFNFGLCITSGFGKEAIKDVIISSAEYLGKNYSSFTSIHEEQLIGKKWFDEKQKKEREEKGYFNDDFLIKDDGLDFINDVKYATARNYMLPALNTYGKNYITKKITTHNNKLKYLAKCSFSYFLQPSEKIKLRNISSGLFRRAPILRIDLNLEEINQIIDKRLSTNFNQQSEEWKDFLSFISFIRNITYSKIDKNIELIINKFVKENVNNCILLESMGITNQNNLIKMGFINALIREYKIKKIGYKTYKTYNSIDIQLTINKEDIDKAINDYTDIYKSIILFANMNANININKIHPIKEKIIEELKKRNCISKENSNIKPKELIDLIVLQSKELESTVSYHFYKMKNEDKIIDSCKIGTTGAKVWLI